MKRKLKVLGLVVWVGVAAVVVGCTTQPRTVPRVTDAAPYEWEKEGDIPSLDTRTVRREADRVDVFEEVPVAQDDLTVESVAPLEPVDVSPAPSDSAVTITRGYRVQVFASGDRATAEQLRAKVAGELQTSAYVELIDGIYKVRVGDCPARGEAEKLLQLCRSLGYADAWIVASSVRIARPSR